MGQVKMAVVQICPYAGSDDQWLDISHELIIQEKPLGVLKETAGGKVDRMIFMLDKNTEDEFALGDTKTSINIPLKDVKII